MTPMKDWLAATTEFIILTTSAMAFAPPVVTLPARVFLDAVASPEVALRSTLLTILPWLAVFILRRDKSWLGIPAGCAKLAGSITKSPLTSPWMFAVKVEGFAPALKPDCD